MTRLEAQRDAHLLRGALPLLILSLLTVRESYGYELVERLTVLGLSATTGLVYPALSRLERDQLVVSHTIGSVTGPPRKYFALTRAGEIARDEATQQWGQIHRAVQTATMKKEELT